MICWCEEEKETHSRERKRETDTNKMMLLAYFFSFSPAIIIMLIFFFFAWADDSALVHFHYLSLHPEKAHTLLLPDHLSQKVLYSKTNSIFSLDKRTFSLSDSEKESFQVCRQIITKLLHYFLRLLFPFAFPPIHVTNKDANPPILVNFRPD